MVKQIRRRTKPRPQGRGAGKNTAAQNAMLPAILWAFGCGMGSFILLLALFAFVCERASLPTNLVRPLALAAAWCAAAVSGYILAGRWGHQRLLCGLGCGVFYCFCVLAASYLSAGEVYLHGGNLALPVALLLGGLIGGVGSALRAGHSTPLR